MKSGFVAILGRPNVGKSTFANCAVGAALAAVSDKPQTTWHQIRGIVTDKRGQIVFVDTPGLHHSHETLNQALVANAIDAALDSDAILLMVDATKGLAATERRLLENLVGKGGVVVAVNKIDLVPPAKISALDAELRAFGVTATFINSAEGAGIDEVLTRLFELLPEGQPLYSPDDLSDRPLRFIVSEYIRQAVYECLHEEVPYNVFVEINEFEEDRRPIHIDATIIVARKSQKQIVIGAGGQMLKNIGIRARELTEKLLGERVYLQLWVKVLHKWNKRENSLRRAGVLLPGRQYNRAQEQKNNWFSEPEQ